VAGLALPEGVARRLLDHTLAELPNEACALLGGDAQESRVASLHLARNQLASPYRYDVDPADLVRIVHAIEAAGEELVATFHSHPTSAPVPSRADRREARYAAIHLICGLSHGRRAFRAWRIERERAVPVPLVIGTPGIPVDSVLRSGRS
jgi:proteasome lid subunit RPN8/RPN11